MGGKSTLVGQSLVLRATKLTFSVQGARMTLSRTMEPEPEPLEGDLRNWTFQKKVRHEYYIYTAL